MKVTYPDSENESGTRRRGSFARMRGMKRRTWLQAVPLLAVLPAGVAEAVGRELLKAAGGKSSAEKKRGGEAMPESTTVYELRIYHAVPGKLDALLARFRDHTDGLFAKHGMKSLAYWTALDEPAKSGMLVYILVHPSREAAAVNWKAFEGDAEWKAVKAKSEENGTLVEKVDSTYLTLTNFSRQPGA